ncbi:hydroxyethylthiazole kinase [Leuconostoc inhae]|uniref:hydroxyethylthiazole kinase n=1 Tax=Leuconostoc inhae TaxID=178001 RepID=UPI001C7CAF99|nr:hydroxyethylthiazole kinase [Leuconostoc inhae]
MITNMKEIAQLMPFKCVPLIHCITNDITLETLANTVLYLGGKPIMSSDTREFHYLFQTTNAVLLNMGRLTLSHEKSLRVAGNLSVATNKPIVVDLVGYGITMQRQQLGLSLVANQPTIVKGNISEMRRFVGLSTSARGVDSDIADQDENALNTLIVALKKLTNAYPNTVFVATGAQDIIVDRYQCIILRNGVPQLDNFVGTGDIVGAMMATLLGAGVKAWEASLFAVSYLNIAAEIAAEKTIGMEDFRRETLNQISLLKNDVNWSTAIRYFDKV